MFAAWKLPLIVESMRNAVSCGRKFLRIYKRPSRERVLENNRKGNQARLIIFAVFIWSIEYEGFLNIKENWN